MHELLDIPGYEGFYKISETGDVFSVSHYVIRKNGAGYTHWATGNPMKWTIAPKSYSETIVLKKNGKKKCFTKKKLLLLAFGYHNNEYRRLENINRNIKNENSILYGSAGR